MYKSKKEIEKEFDERFPISIDYPPIAEMEVFTQIEIDARVKRAKAKNEMFLSYLLQTREEDRVATIGEILSKREQ